MGTIFLYLCLMKMCLTVTEGVEICGKLFRFCQRLQLWWLKKFYLLHKSVNLQTTYSNIIGFDNNKLKKYQKYCSFASIQCTAHHNNNFA